MAKIKLKKKFLMFLTLGHVVYAMSIRKIRQKHKENHRNTVKTWLCRQLMWQPWIDLTQSMTRPNLWVTAVPSWWFRIPTLTSQNAFSLQVSHISSYIDQRKLFFHLHFRSGVVRQASSHEPPLLLFGKTRFSYCCCPVQYGLCFSSGVILQLLIGYESRSV